MQKCHVVRMGRTRSLFAVSAEFHSHVVIILEERAEVVLGLLQQSVVAPPAGRFVLVGGWEAARSGRGQGGAEATPRGARGVRHRHRPRRRRGWGEGGQGAVGQHVVQAMQVTHEHAVLVPQRGHFVLQWRHFISRLVGDDVIQVAGRVHNVPVRLSGHVLDLETKQAAELRTEATTKHSFWCVIGQHER